ncbi:MAG: RNA polymerase sigma factor [bacterium]|nr:RNA polymerase sigma factor [bacterium]
MDLADLIETYRDALVGLISSWGPRGADAVSLAQDSFAEAYLRRESCRGDWQDASVFGPWLRGVAHNVVRNWKRSEQRRRHRIVTSEAAVHAAEAPDGEVSERILAVREAIERLPKKQREDVLMHYTSDTRVDDVAAWLGGPAKTVEGRLYQARRALRRLLEGPTSSVSLRGVLLCL